MGTLLLIMLMSTQQPKLCKHRVIVYRNSQPTCTFKELGRATIQGYDRNELYTNIQTLVCNMGGHAILTRSETRGSTGMTLTGIVVRCNVPFLLPSDLRPRE